MGLEEMLDEHVNRTSGYGGGWGCPRIISDELIRHIQGLAKKGMSPSEIARTLEKENILTPTGKKKWYVSHVTKILSYKLMKVKQNG